MTAHLALMSKPRLLKIIEGLEARARQHAEMADYWRSVTAGLIRTTPKPAFTPSPETTLAEARRILRALPTDPNAQEHRDTLRSELNLGASGTQQRRPGPRCERNGCDHLLNAEGSCSRCDWYRIRKAAS